MDFPEHPQVVSLRPEDSRRESERRHRWKTTADQARVVANAWDAAAVWTPVVVVISAV